MASQRLDRRLHDGARVGECPQPVGEAQQECLPRLGQLAVGDVHRGAGEARRRAVGVAHQSAAHQRPAHRSVRVDNAVFVEERIGAGEHAVEFGLDRRPVVRVDDPQVAATRHAPDRRVGIDAVDAVEVRVAVNDADFQVAVPDADHAGRAERQGQPLIAALEALFGQLPFGDVAAHRHQPLRLAVRAGQRRDHHVPPFGRALVGRAEALEAPGPAGARLGHRRDCRRVVGALPHPQPRQADDGIRVGDLHRLDPAGTDEHVVAIEVEHHDAVAAGAQDEGIEALRVARDGPGWVSVHRGHPDAARSAARQASRRQLSATRPRSCVPASNRFRGT